MPKDANDLKDKNIMKYAEITESIIGATMAVHNCFGGGFQ